MTSLRVRILVAVSLLAIWVVTLALPVAELERASFPSALGKPSNVVTGFYMFENGALGFIELQFAWLANPLIWWLAWRSIATHRYRSGRAYILACLVLVACIISAIRWNSIYINGSMNDVTRYLEGYYLWYAVVSVAAIWSMILGRQRLLSSDIVTDREI